MHKKVIVYVLLVSLLLTGCWDKVEIEERAHISALGIDVYPPYLEGLTGVPSEGKEIEFAEAQDINRNKFSFTFAYPKESLDETEDIIIKTVGESFYGVSRILSDRTNKEIFLGHLRTVVLNSEVAKDSDLFREVLDGIESNEFISRRIILTMTDDKASDIINVKPSMQPRVGQFISELFTRRDRTPRVPEGAVGEILQDLHEGGCTLIPRVTAGKTDVKAEGAAIIKNYKFEGWLGGIETGTLMILKGGAPISGGVSIDYKGHSLPIEMRPHKPKMSLVESEDNIKILVEIEGEADIKQAYLEANYELTNPEVVKEIEELYSRTLEDIMKNSINKIQKEHKVDVIGIGTFLRQRHYDLWKTVEKDWEEIFPNIDIEVRMDVKIRRVGLTQ